MSRPNTPWFFDWNILEHNMICTCYFCNTPSSQQSVKSVISRGLVRFWRISGPNIKVFNRISSQVKSDQIRSQSEKWNFWSGKTLSQPSFICLTKFELSKMLDFQLGWKSGKFQLAIKSSVVSLTQLVSPSVALLAKPFTQSNWHKAIGEKGNLCKVNCKND